jgi:hypothetical protein
VARSKPDTDPPTMSIVVNLPAELEKTIAAEAAQRRTAR